MLIDDGKAKDESINFALVLCFGIFQLNKGPTKVTEGHVDNSHDRVCFLLFLEINFSRLLCYEDECTRIELDFKSLFCIKAIF